MSPETFKYSLKFRRKISVTGLKDVSEMRSWARDLKCDQVRAAKGGKRQGCVLKSQIGSQPPDKIKNNFKKLLVYSQLIE